jgi:RHH-type transcriptional regulator, proline utilization regulon repressor / proline dehydrogenase / delta 1-pyrroline-5-carboxylate dehydrogenase
MTDANKILNEDQQKTITPLLSVAAINNEWDAIFNSDFSIHLCNGKSKLLPEIRIILEKYTKIKESDFKIQLVLNSVSFLAGIFPGERALRLYTPRLNHELFLLELLKGSIPEKSIYHTYYSEYRVHVDSIRNIDDGGMVPDINLALAMGGCGDFLLDERFFGKDPVTEERISGILREMNKYRPELMERITDRLLELAAEYSIIRENLLKFLVILPSLTFDRSGKVTKQIFRESLEHFLESNRSAKKKLPAWMTLSARVSLFKALLMPPGILRYFIRKGVRLLARRFIAGESIGEASAVVRELLSRGRDVTLDQLGEKVFSVSEADSYRDKVLLMIMGFREFIKPGEKNRAGINRAHISIKVSALCPDFRPCDREYVYSQVAPGLEVILKTAGRENVFVNIDAERFSYRDTVFWVCRRLLLESEALKGFKLIGFVLQAYLRDALHHLDEIIDLGDKLGFVIPLRLVKGAYWDSEIVEAEAGGYTPPVFLNKEETDLMFRAAAVRILKNPEHLQLCVASHNYSDHCYSESIKEQYFQGSPVIEHQCLHMTYETLSQGIVKMGWVLREYMPVGSLLVGMAYLVRRIMENSSQAGVLSLMRSHKKGYNLSSPVDMHRDNLSAKRKVHDLNTVSFTGNFINTIPLRTHQPEELERMVRVLDAFPREKKYRRNTNRYPVSGKAVSLLSPSDPEKRVGIINFAVKDDVQKAVNLTEKALRDIEWWRENELFRSAVLARSALLLRMKRSSFASLVMYEAGKTLKEALGDVDEAVDFLNFYAREEIKLHTKNPGYRARGVFAVIAPWNFPVAIPCGMTAGALAAGNSVILKSAEQTPLVAEKFVRLLHDSGVPGDILIHLPGLGEDVGSALVEDPGVAGIVFTGSKEVGLEIIRKGGVRFIRSGKSGEIIPVKVIAEMGGKNGIIVTETSDLDEAVSGILISAFNHAGQKCSACSRVIADYRIKEHLVRRLKDAASALRVGSSLDFSTWINPLITEGEMKRVRETAAGASAEAERFGGNVIINRTGESPAGYSLGPGIFELPGERAVERESFAFNELFAPLIHIIEYRTLDQALEIINATGYALTAGIYSQSQDEIDFLLPDIEAGNIYVNRGITGARVDIEPFGGFKFSGTGPKAGGRDYLPAFHHSPRTNQVVEREEFQEVQKPDSGRGGREIENISIAAHTIRAAYPELSLLLDNYERWLGENLVSFINSPRYNREVPGQISCNDYRMCDRQALFIIENKKMDTSTAMRLISALALGVKIIIEDKNREIKWEEISGVELLNDADNGFISRSSIRKIIFDAESSSIEKRMKEIYEAAPGPELIKIHYSQYDAPPAGDYSAYLLEFIKVRSFAINTMKHGAELKLMSKL